jgi:uncharacterized membrane protein YfcA
MDAGLFDVYLPVAGLHFNVLVLLAIGFSVGVLGGFFGVGGAWVVTPALNIFGFPMAYAIGTDLAHIFGKSIVATKKHGRMGNVDVKMGLISIVGSVVGVEAGAQVIMLLGKHRLDEDVVRVAYMVLLFGLAAFMFYDYFTKDRRQKKAAAGGVGHGGPVAPTKSWLRDLPPMVNFFLTGLLSGFLGVGGGFIRMPALIYLIGCPTAIAIGTDLFSVVFTGAYGCFTYALKGRVEIIAALWMLVGASVGAQLGVTAVKYVHGYGIRLLFAIMIVLAGGSVALKQAGLVTAAAYVVLVAALAICAAIIIRLGRGFLKERHGERLAPADNA